MKRFSVALWASYLIPPIFLVVYFVIISGFGINLNLTPVIPTGLFSYFDSYGNPRIFISALGVFDFLTWGWLAKLVFSLIGFLWSLLLLPLNILLAFIPTFIGQGDPLREAGRKTVKYIKFLLYSRRPIHRRWTTLTTLCVWMLSYLTMMAIFFHIMQLTTVTVPAYTWIPQSLPFFLQYVLPNLGDPTLTLPFIPLHAFRLAVHSGVIFYTPSAIYLSSVLIGLLLVLLFSWAIKGHQSVEENMSAFSRWFS